MSTESTMKIVTAREVSAALKKAGLTTGLRYTQTGHVNRHGQHEPVGYTVTRLTSTRYSGNADAGEVRIYSIDETNPGNEPAMVDKAEEVLRAAGFDVRRRGSLLSVPDTEDRVTRTFVVEITAEPYRFGTLEQITASLRTGLADNVDINVKEQA